MFERRMYTCGRCTAFGLAIVVAALIWSIPLIWNGFPFLYFDSGYYIINIFYNPSKYGFIWRPLTFSTVLLPLVLPAGLKMGLVFHNVLLAGLIFWVGRVLSPRLTPLKFVALATAMLLTPLVYYEQFILPDVYCGIMILAAGALAVPLGRRTKFDMGAIFVFSGAMHFTNILIGSMLLAVQLLRPNPNFTRKVILVWLALPWLFVTGLNWQLTDRMRLSDTAHIFLFSKLMATQVAIEYLNEECPALHNALCNYREIPFKIWEWSPEGRIAKLGGLKAISQDIAAVNWAILLSPRLLTFLARGSETVVGQLLTFARPLPLTYEDPWLEKSLTMIQGDVLDGYHKQNLRAEDNKTLNSILFPLYLTVTLLSLVALVYWASRGKLGARIATTFYCCALAYLFNGLVCGLLTDPQDRYSARLIWVFPFLVVLHLLEQSRTEPRAF